MILFACEQHVLDPEGANAEIRAHAGGAVSFGEATLWIPAGSLAEDTTIGLAALAELPATETGRFVAARHAYELTPHGTEFALASPAVLGVTVDGAALAAQGLDPRTAQLFHWREDSSSYVAVASTFDDRTGMLTAAIEHFSKYVVMAQAAAATAPGPTVSMQGTVPDAVRAGAPLYLRATVVPNAGTAIAAVRVYYQKLHPAPQPPVEAVMAPDRSPAVPGSNTYGFVVPAGFLTAADLGPGPDLAYYAEATDSLGVTTTLAATPTLRDVTLAYAAGSLRVAPAELTISAGFERWLTVTGVDSEATEFPLIAESAVVSDCPGPTGEPLGEVDDQRASGLHFRALRACDGSIDVVSGADAVSVPVAVRAGHLESLVLYRYEQVGPSEIRTLFDGTFSLPEGHAIELDAEGSDGFGNTLPVNVTWGVDPSIGTIDGNGRLYVLDGAGFGKVSARVGGVGGVGVTQWFNVIGRAWGAVGALEVASTTNGGDLGAARADHTATLLQNGKILVTGGVNESGTLATARIYDPVTNTWTAAASMSAPRAQHTATLLANGKVVIAGGIDGEAISGSCEIYDPVANTWTAAGTMMRLRHQHTSTLLPNGKILNAGGYLFAHPLVGADLYNPVTGTADYGYSALLASARLHTATVLPSGRILFAGGNDAGAIANATLYDPATATWTAATAMSAVRQSHTATLLPNGRVLVAGGTSGTGAYATALLYDPPTNAWTTAASMGVARHSHTATLLPDGRVLVTGGDNGSGGAVSSAELYDPLTNQWTPTTPLVAARRGHVAIQLANGRVLMTGGRGSAALASAEVYYSAEPAIEPALAFSGSTPYAAWHEASPSGSRVFVKRWNGTSWVQDGPALNNDLAREATSPRIGFAGTVPYVVWREGAAGGAGQIYVKRWTGTAWVQDAAGSLNVAAARDAASPSIAIAGAVPYVAWDEQTLDARAVYVRRWNGTSWVQLGANVGSSPILGATRPSIAVVGSTPYVAWEQMTSRGARAIEVKRWTGSLWEPVGGSILANPAGEAVEPRLAIAGGTPYVTWRETFAGSSNIYVAHFASGTWVRDGGSLSRDAAQPSASPSIAFYGTTPYVAWRERSGGAFQIFVKHLNGATWIQNGGGLNADPTQSAFAPALLLDGPTPYAAWAEAAGPLYTLRAKRLE